MRTLFALAMCMVFVGASAQKKKENGAVFSKHPAIKMVQDLNEAFVSGDSAALADLLDDEFKLFDALSSNKDQEGTTKAQFIGQARWWSKNIKYLSITQDEPAYPDAIEYTEGGQVWVQCWDRIYGMNAQTGVEFDMPNHRLYMLNEAGDKIALAFDYTDRSNYRKMWDAWPTRDRENGTIYMNHENINTVRKMMYSFLNGDLETSYSYFTEDAQFNDMNREEPYGMEENKAGDAEFLANWELIAFDERGYPDYMEYDWLEARVVQSWWNIRLKKKGDKDAEEVVVRMLRMDDFNAEGKITSSDLYYNAALLAD